MTETQKLDFILRAIYDAPDQEGNLLEILAEKDLKFTRKEIDRLVALLKRKGFVTISPEIEEEDGPIFVTLQSKGVKFVERDSSVKKGTLVVKSHYNISNSTNTNIVTESSGTTITQHYNSELEQLLDQIRETIKSDAVTAQEQRQEVIDCVDDVKAGLKSNRIPKVSYKQLLDVGSKIASISNFLLKLKEVVGSLPS